VDDLYFKIPGHAGKKQYSAGMNNPQIQNHLPLLKTKRNVSNYD